MHIVIPYAAPAGASIQQALRQVQVPHLRALLTRLDATPALQGAATDLSPLHERVLAQHTWPTALLRDGLLPWAAAEARAHNLHPDAAHWAFLTLGHWVVHADHVAMADPAQLQVTEVESHALQDAMRAYFAEDGITLYPHQAGTWLASGAVFQDLPTAALDRVRGQTVDPWMPRQAQAKALRRLQNEMQMLLYTHPVNDARLARALPAINAFWVSGTGALPAAHSAATRAAVTVVDALRSAALQDDAAAWLAAWQSLDSGPLAALHAQTEAGTAAALALTLCGDHAASTYTLQSPSFWTRMARRLSPPDVPALLKNL